MNQIGAELAGGWRHAQGGLDAGEESSESCGLGAMTAKSGGHVKLGQVRYRRGDLARRQRGGEFERRLRRRLMPAVPFQHAQHAAIGE